MGRIEYWLLGAVGALIAFVTFESVKSTVEPRRYSLQIEQAGHSRDSLEQSGPTADSATAEAPATTFDVHSAMRPSRSKAPIRNVFDVRRRITDGAQRTYILDMLASQDSVLFRWPDNTGTGTGLRVWIQDNPHVPGWCIG